MKLINLEELLAINPDTGTMACAVAHYIAAAADITPGETGKALDAKGIHITQCQLGLFGFGRKGTGSYKNLGRPVEVDEEILARIRAAAENGRIPCLTLWQIAADGNVTRTEVGNAADHLGLKVTPCQLGAF